VAIRYRRFVKTPSAPSSWTFRDNPLVPSSWTFRDNPLVPFVDVSGQSIGLIFVDVSGQSIGPIFVDVSGQPIGSIFRVSSYHYTLRNIPEANKNITSYVLRDVVHSFGEGVRYLSNFMWIRGIGIRVIPFTPIWDVQSFLHRFSPNPSTTVSRASLLYVILTKSDKNEENRDRNCVLSNCVDFHETRHHSVHFCTHSLHRVLCKSVARKYIQNVTRALTSLVTVIM
jgi:hypothetical protein